MAQLVEGCAHRLGYTRRAIVPQRGTRNADADVARLERADAGFERLPTAPGRIECGKGVGHVGDARCQHPRRVERPAQRHDAVRQPAAGARLEADGTRHARRHPYRARRVAAECHHRRAFPQAHPGTSRGAAGDPVRLGVPRVARRAPMRVDAEAAKGELDGMGLSHHHAELAAQRGDDRALALPFGRQSLRGAREGRPALDPVKVLDRHRNALERPGRSTACEGCVRSARLQARLVRTPALVGVETAAEVLVARECRLHELERGDLPAAECCCDGTQGAGAFAGHSGGESSG